MGGLGWVEFRRVDTGHGLDVWVKYGSIVNGLDMGGLVQVQSNP